MREKLKCSLKEILDFLGLNPNQLFEMTQRKVRQKTIYAMFHDQAKSIKLDNTEKILTVLNDYAEENNIEKRFDTQDLFPYIHKNENKKGL
ncbi:hypothetical protein [Priestia aryabhattai]|jgi:predicted transcriptional regulator|uniref:HTH cro/C1-type domain-containing protein n=1 Tax=Priestia aryabhattai TaxID=412384 RepID=A0ABD7X4Z4_PRIAR|nr:hypothetical protein [Priestia aryabhattai]WEA47307.1 hypothetical protein PWO00_28440 [Priestia aryabhattai]